MSGYEDEILDAVIAKDYDKFDELINKYQQYLSDEKITYLNSLWNDVRTASTDLVPVEGTKRSVPTVAELRRKSEQLTTSVRKATNSIFSLITMLGNYTSLLPQDVDENIALLDRL